MKKKAARFLVRLPSRSAGKRRPFVSRSLNGTKGGGGIEFYIQSSLFPLGEAARFKHKPLGNEGMKSCLIASHSPPIWDSVVMVAQVRWEDPYLFHFPANGD